MIRKLEIQDHDQFKLWVQNFSPSANFNWTPDQLFESWKTCEIWGNFEQKNLISAIALQKNQDNWEILWLATQPGHQGQGHMHLLLGHILNNATHNGVNVLLEVHEGNLSALSLYTQAGFKHVGTRKNYYKDGKSAWLMTYKAV